MSNVNSQLLMQAAKVIQSRTKAAVVPAMPPMDPAMMGGGGMPMDPAMMGGAPPGMPMDPAMMGVGAAMGAMPPSGAPPAPAPAPAPAAPPAEGAPGDPLQLIHSKLDAMQEQLSAVATAVQGLMPGLGAGAPPAPPAPAGSTGEKKAGANLATNLHAAKSLLDSYRRRQQPC